MRAMQPNPIPVALIAEMMFITLCDSFANRYLLLCKKADSFIVALNVAVSVLKFSCCLWMECCPSLTIRLCALHNQASYPEKRLSPEQFSVVLPNMSKFSSN